MIDTFRHQGLRKQLVTEIRKKGITDEAVLEAINSELDVYVPSLNLAFELNGIFHYEPIYGEKKLNQILSKYRFYLKSYLHQNI